MKKIQPKSKLGELFYRLFFFLIAMSLFIFGLATFLPKAHASDVPSEPLPTQFQCDVAWFMDGVGYIEYVETGFTDINMTVCENGVIIVDRNEEGETGTRYYISASNNVLKTARNNGDFGGYMQHKMYTLIPDTHAFAPVKVNVGDKMGCRNVSIGYVLDKQSMVSDVTANICFDVVNIYRREEAQFGTFYIFKKGVEFRKEASSQFSGIYSFYQRHEMFAALMSGSSNDALKTLYGYQFNRPVQHEKAVSDVKQSALN